MRMIRDRVMWPLLWICSIALFAPVVAGAAAPAGVAGPMLVQEAAGGAAGATDSSATDSSAALEAAPPSSPDDYVAQVRAEFTPENQRYARTRTMLSLVNPLYAVLAGLLILFAGWAARMRDLAQKVTRFRYVHTLLFFVMYIAVSMVLSLPLDYYAGYALEHQYGLSNQTLPEWGTEQIKGAFVGIMAMGVIPLLWLAYGAIRRSKRWWMWLGFGTLPVILTLVLVQPLVIDPMFNKFEPLKDKVLEARVLALAEKTGIPGRNVYQVDKSEQTKKLNAYVNGFGASQRVVFWDTIIAAMDHDELAFVAGHEMGHYKLGHVWKTVGFLSALSFLLFFLIAKLMTWLTARFSDRWGFTELHDIASLPLLSITLTVVSFFAQPAVYAFSRFQEHQADIYALEVTHLNNAGATAFLKLGTENKSNPDPSALETWLLWTHPPVVERVRFMQTYRPWEEGKANQLFKP
jgi:Zn-dependent protease with chaperone function